MLNIDPHPVALSTAAQRLLKRPRPRYRGTLHTWAAILAAPIGALIISRASTQTGRIGAFVFTVGAVVMLGVSAYVQGRDWPAHAVERLIRLDHSAIFLTFPTTATPIALMAFEGRSRIWLLAVLWGGAAMGVLLEWLPIHAPRGLMNAMYLTLGWSTLVFLPQMMTSMSGIELALLLVGGAIYTVGAIIVGSQKPDPWPVTFGYHEIWHVCVVVAVGLHAWMTVELVS